MSKQETTTRHNDKASNFVDYVIKQCRQDKGQAARLKRADNPNTEYQSWEVLANFGIDLEKDYQRLPFALIAAAIANSKAEENGNLLLGQAIAACYEDGNNSVQAKARLRRLLACDNTAEVCRILRPQLTLINSRVSQTIDFIKLLNQLQYFDFDESKQRIRAQWAQGFYHKSNSKEMA